MMTEKTDQAALLSALTTEHFVLQTAKFVDRNGISVAVANAGYSGSVSPDPPISLGMSLILGSPSLIWRTASW
jgi:hypothetical protein